jgi:hypothetical protein
MEKEVLYWDDATRIRRLEKRTGTVIDFPLDRGYGTLVLVSDETNLYLAEPGCVTMMTMNKQTGALSDIERKDPNSYQGGWFSIAMGNGYVYCSAGNGGVLYRRPTNGGAVTQALQLPHDHPRAYKPEVGSMVIVGSTLFMIRSYTSEDWPSHFLAKVDLTKDHLPLPQDLTARIPVLPGVMEYDAKRETLYWSSALSLLRYAIRTGELKQAGADVFTLDNHPYGSYLAQDEDYLYWHTHGPYVRVFRQRKLDPKLH